MELKYIELFAGIGGFTNGFKTCNSAQPTTAIDRPAEFEIQQGRQRSLDERGWHDLPNRYEQYPSDTSFKCVWANEWDRHAASIYRRNCGPISETDLRAVNIKSIPDHDLCTFGWPCQDNSIAGKRAGQKSNTRSGLIHKVIEVLRIKKPKYFIAENVTGLFSVNDGNDFYETIRMFANVGYDVQWQVINTRWFLPQSRKRIYFVGHIRNERRPQVFPICETDGLYSETNQQVAQAIDRSYHKGYRNNQQRSVVLAWSKSHRTGSGEYDSNRHNYGTIEHRINTDGFNTLNTGTGCSSMSTQNFIQSGPLEIRRLTPRECERLQGFPDDWTRYGETETGETIEISDRQRYAAIGNAVSGPAVAAVAGKLIQAITSH